MKPIPFAYLAPHTVKEALSALADNAESRPIAGGQSLMPMLALRIARPELLVDLNRITELAQIREENGEICIGSMVRQATLLASPLINKRLPLVALALQSVGHPPTRARGTIGGSLSHADPGAELPSVMVAEDAKLVVRRRDGERTIAAEQFFRGLFETAIMPGELLTEIRLPATVARSGFTEIARRKGDLAVALAAAKIAQDTSGKCTFARIVLGAVTPAPVRCHAIEERLLGRPIEARTITEAVAALADRPDILDSNGAGAAYRRRVAPVVLRRALMAASAGGMQ